MSANSRRLQPREENDFYPTPRWCVDRLLERVPVEPGTSWIEPSAGDGALVRAVRERDPSALILAFELSPVGAALVEAAGADACDTGDALAMDWPPADTVIMNPPFSLAVEFVTKALLAAPVVICLERSVWVHTWARRGTKQMPAMHILPQRPSFTRNGKTDAAEYSWFVWGIGPGVHLLDDTPLDVRKARK